MNQEESDFRKRDDNASPGLFRFSIREFLLLVVILSIAAAWYTRNRDWNPEVLRLFSLNESDDALRKIIDEAKYAPNSAYPEQSDGKVMEVLVCPQRQGVPLVAILVNELRYKGRQIRNESSYKHAHLIVMRSDGTIIPWYRGANMVSKEDHLGDLNLDGVIDCVQSWNIRHSNGLLTNLVLIPVEEPFLPSLVIYWKEGEYNWRLNQTGNVGEATIQIGTGHGDKFKVAAEYSWSSSEEKWVGPRGSPEKGFVMEENGEAQTAMDRVFE